jgi:hypothetical protein
LVELNQRHEATITKDRTGKFQDETIEKPGEDFGVALYDWLSSGSTVIPAPATTTTSATEPAPAKTNTPAAKPVPASTSATKTKLAKGTGIKERRQVIVNAIGDIVTSKSANGDSSFTEDEKEEARQLIKTISLDENGIKELEELKVFLAGELAKRNALNTTASTTSATAKAA